MSERDKVILAYSGGLDTSVAIKWIQDEYDVDVVALTIDLGQGRDLTAIKEKAVKVGAVKAIVVDAKAMFLDYFVWPALMADAVYEGQYPLATALGRPLIAKLLVDIAQQEGASAVAHGCTGKGNDQVRIDVSVHTLDPSLRVIAPAREWRWTRNQEMEYARKNDIPVPVTKKQPYSTDQNLWGRSIEAGVLEDPWEEPPANAWEWTVDPREAPAEPVYVEIEFRQGRPVGLDGEKLDSVTLVQRLHDLAGQHGIGRVDHVENRLVGIKSRELYEAPAATVLHTAHQALETLTLSKQAVRFKTYVAQEYADLIYNGLWFCSHHQDLLAYVISNQRFVSGTVRVRLHRGACTVVGRQSPHSLYSKALATYDTGDQFDHKAAVGFIWVHGLAQQTQMQLQLQAEEPELYRIPVLRPPAIGVEEQDVSERK